MNFSSSSTTRFPTCSAHPRSLPEQRVPPNGSPGLSRASCCQSLLKIHPRVWRPASSILNRPEGAADSSATLMASTIRRRHHHVTDHLHHPRGLSPPRWLPSVQTRACCSSAGQDSFPFAPSSSRYTGVSTRLGRACSLRSCLLPESVHSTALQGPRTPSEESHPTDAPGTSHPTITLSPTLTSCFTAPAPSSPLVQPPSPAAFPRPRGLLHLSGPCSAPTLPSGSRNTLLPWALLSPEHRCSSTSSKAHSVTTSPSHLWEDFIPAPVAHHLPRREHAASDAVCLATVPSVHRSVPTDLHGVF